MRDPSKTQSGQATEEYRMTRRSKKWGTLAALLLVYFTPNYMQYQLSPISQDIMQMYSITPAMFSKVFSAPMIPAVFLSLISGILTDKYGAKPVLGISLVLTALGSVLRMFSSTYTLLFLGMVLIGVSAAVVNANGVKVLSGYIPPEKLSLFTGIFLVSSTVAMTLGTGTTSLFPSVRSVYRTAVIIGVLTVIVWFVFSENTTPKVNKESGSSVLSELKKAARIRSVWLAGVSLFFVLACLIGIASFLPMALAKRGMSDVVAGSYTAVFTAGNLVGSFVSPAIDQIWKHTKVQILIIIALIGCGTASAWSVPAGLPLFAVLLLTGIGIGGILPIMMSLPVRLGEVAVENAGVAGGIISTLQLMGAIVLPSYIIAPIAGDNLSLFFIITGSLMGVPFLINLISAVRAKKD